MTREQCCESTDHGGAEMTGNYNAQTDTYFLGVNDKGLACYASGTLIYQKSMSAVRENFGLVRRYPVRTNLSGGVVMVAGDSHEDAVNRYLRGKK